MMSFGVGYMLQPCFAFLLRDAMWYQLASSALSFFYPFVMLYVSQPRRPLRHVRVAAGY